MIFTGYLIIYNIFRISVSSDVRFYGLLKAIGTTPRQLKRMIRYQALYLSVVGIPIGFLGGYGVGSVLTPIVMSATTMGEVVKISTSLVAFSVRRGIFRDYGASLLYASGTDGGKNITGGSSPLYV